MELPEQPPRATEDFGHGDPAVCNPEWLETFFKTWAYSLLNLRNEVIPGLVQLCPETVRYHEAANYETAKILLQNGDVNIAWKYIEYAFSKDPDNIHAWCNKGMYHLRKRPVELREAQEAREKMEALMREEEPMNEAKVETACWLHQRDGSVAVRRRAFHIISEMTNNSDLTPSQQSLYLQMLVYDVKSSSCFDRQQKFEKIDEISNRILSSEGDERKFTVLCQLLRVFANSTCLTYINTQMAGRLGGLNESEVVQQLMALKTLVGETLSSNDYGEMGRIQLSIALRVEDDKKKLQLLQEGLEIAEKYPDGREGRYNYAPKVCSSLLLSIWAIKYCMENHEQAKRECIKQATTLKKALWRFVSTEYWPTAPDPSPPNRHLLNKAKMYLEVFRGNTQKFDDFNYPRVLALLGEPDQHIQDAFEESLEHCVRQRDQILAHKGLYLEHKQNWVESEQCFREALDIDGCNWMARHGLQRVLHQMRR